MTEQFYIDRLASSFPPSSSLSLFHLSITPVQEFISEARKMKDLWAGSYILSKVTFEAMIPVIEKYGSDTILIPSLNENPLKKSYACLPNHFLAVIPEDAVSSITSEIKNRVENLSMDLGKDARSNISKALGGSYPDWDKLWEFQVKDHFQVLWVALPVTMDDLKNAYKEKYIDIQRFMEGRKITRTFQAWKGNSAYKCGQCGHREILGPPESGKNKIFWSSLRKVRGTRGIIKEGERLCSICLIKRLVKEAQLINGPEKKIPFESTSDISSIPFRKILLANSGNKSVQDLFNALRKLHEMLKGNTIETIEEIPGDWLYSEGLEVDSLLKEHRVDKDQSDSLKETAQDAQRELNKVYQEIKKRPSKYYAILIMDGDKMGEYLSGEKMLEGEDFSLDWQIRQSNSLSELATTGFPPIIDEWGGTIIYSGGDDLLAYGPLEGALESFKGLRKAFCDKIKKPTTSGCMVIAHHQDSLRRAMEEARGGIERAKEEYGRNSLVISLRFSSGSSIFCGYKWKHAAFPISPWEVIGTMTNWMTRVEKGLGIGFVYDLLQELSVFYLHPYSKGRQKKSLNREMFAIESRRLLKRHIPKDSIIWKEEYQPGKKYTDLLIESLAVIGDPSEKKAEELLDSEENLASLLRLTSFIAREEV